MKGEGEVVDGKHWGEHMDRRDFVGAVGATALGGAAFRPGRARRSAPTFGLDFAPHFGMFRQSAGADVVAQLRWMHAEGFRSLEDNGMRGRPVAEQERIGAEMKRLGMRMGVFVLNPGTAFNKVTFAAGEEEFRTSFLADVDASIEVARRVNAKWMTVVPGNFDRRIRPKGKARTEI